MKQLFKKILIGLGLIILPILGYSQHIIDNPNEPEKSRHIGAYNFKYLETSTRSSEDSIHISSSEILSGDSILMLTGDKSAVITEAGIVYSGTTPYTTTGTTDTTAVYSISNGISTPVLYILDELYESNNSFLTYNTGGTYRSNIDSTYYYLKIPSNKFSVGDGEYILYYKYLIFE